ncbi:MAG: hypothetical protein ACUVT5_04605 [Candidatus Bathyarchaeales archaeon]
MRCKACDKEANKKSGYCERHTKAYEIILSKYEIWKKALDIGWKEYLNNIVENSLTGKWAKEVAQRLLEENSILLE